MKKNLATVPLISIIGLVGTGVLQPAPANQVIDEPLIKDVRAFQNSSNSSEGYNFTAVLAVIAVILAFGWTVGVVRKALNPSRSSLKRADFKQTGGQDKVEIIEDTTLTNKHIAPTSYVEKAYTSFRQRDVQTAIAELDRAISLHPHNAYLYIERAKFGRQNLGDRQGVLEDYMQAINLYPNNALFYLWRSQIYHEIGDKLKAMADYNTAIRLAPEDTMYHLFQVNVNSESNVINLLLPGDKLN